VGDRGSRIIGAIWGAFMRIIIFEGAIEPLDFQLEEIRRVLVTKYAAEVLVINSKNLLQGLGQLENFTKQKVDCLFTMNNLGINLSLSGNSNLWELFQIPIINLIVDHPMNYDEVLLNAPSNMVLGVVDRNHIDYVKRFYPNIREVFFFPLGGVPTDSIATENVDDNCTDAVLNRDIDIFYPGGISKPFLGNMVPDDLEKYQKYFDIEKFQHEIFDRLTEEPAVTFEKAVEDKLVSLSIIPDTLVNKSASNAGNSEGNILGIDASKTNIESDIFLRQTISDFRFLEGLACSYFRENIIHEIISAGLKVTVCGNGWNALPISQEKNFEYLGLVPMNEVLNLMLRSKIVLNTLTWFKAGFHDRIPNAMLRHAASITDESSYINERFPENGKEMLYFSLSEISTLPDIINELLSNDDKRNSMAERGYEKAMREDTWEARVEQYLLPEIEKLGDTY
jgi:hypothetical protein